MISMPGVNVIGIRREDKSEWERRVPLTPHDAAQLREQGLEIIVQSSGIRAFDDQEFAKAGIPVQEDLLPCSVVFGIKEMPEAFFQPGKTYVFFAHVIKGQPYNMSMLQRLLDLGCTLIDYERIVDEKNRRLIFFGWHAGVAGMIDTLWALGQRLGWEGIPNPFDQLGQTLTYRDLDAARTGLAGVRTRIESEGLPEAVSPLIVGVAGYGNVSRGAQEMLDLLPIIEIEPRDLPSLVASQDYSRHHLYKVVFQERHTVEPVDPSAPFVLQDYYDHPEKYRGVFAQYLPYLTVLVNAIYWTERYPRLVTKDGLRALLAAPQTRLRVIGDISCDVEGAIEVTVKSTEPGDPIYVYDPFTGTVNDGHAGRGVVIMAVDILPSELPREASADFSRILKPYLPDIARCDLTASLQELDLPPEIRRAVIVHRGKLAPDYEYIQDYLDDFR
jgi:saccharopine dehydrogenase (NAD+, L-lysine-forming)